MDPSSDPFGSNFILSNDTSPSDKAADLMTAINRQADQLDSFNNKLSFTTSGLFTFNWSGSPTTGVQSFQHGLNYPPIFLAYYNISTNGLWYPCDDLQVDNTGLVTFEAYCSSDTTNITGNFTALVSSAPAIVTIKYFLLQEPATTAS